MHLYSCWVHATTSPTGLHLQETLGQVFGQFARLIARRQALDPQAMSRTDYFLLAILEQSAHEAGLRTSHLASIHGQDVSTVSRRLTHLEAHGLLERLPDPSDGRASTVRLTAYGRTVLNDERVARSGLFSEILADWPEHDLADLDRLMTRLSADLATDAQSAALHPSSLDLTTGRTSA